MEMLSGSDAVLLVLVLLVAALVFTAVRVLGGRATRGDHPDEEGYDPEQHRQL